MLKNLITLSICQLRYGSHDCNKLTFVDIVIQAAAVAVVIAENCSYFYTIPTDLHAKHLGNTTGHMTYWMTEHTTSV